MSRLSAIDLMFLLLENQQRPVHMSSCVIFAPPARSKKGHFVSRVVEAFRSSEVGEPFNFKLKWLGSGLASWERCEPDLNYHVRRVAVPAPGGREQLAETLALLNAPLLDRAYPLWQCFVIEGLENGQFALFFKMHHAIIDGEGGVKAFQDTLTTDPKDTAIRPFWAPRQKVRRDRTVDRVSPLSRLISAARVVPGETAATASELMKIGAEALQGGLRRGELPFQAPGTPFNVPTTSSARCYADCELSLDTVKTISKASGCTVNDVVMTLIDHSLNRYLVAEGRGVDHPLVAAMPVSARAEGKGASGNQVSSDLVPMGEPGASITERLAQIQTSTSRVKAKAQRLTLPVRQAYSLLLLGATTLPDLLPGYSAPPTYNVIISNMAGPRGQFYTGGAALIGFIGMPIVPPTPGLNVTFLSFNDHICLAVGSTPETMSDPGAYIRMLKDAFGELQQAIVPARPARRKTPAKKTARKRH